MLHVIFTWLIKSLFKGMAFIFEDVVNHLQLSADGLASLVPGFAGFVPAKIMDSFIITLAVVVIFVSLYKAIVTAFFSPIAANAKENPAISVLRCALAAVLIMLAPTIINYAWTMLREVKEWVTSGITIPIYSDVASETFSFPEWVNRFGTDTWFNETLGSEVVSLIWAGILFYEMCCACVTFIERYIVFGVMLSIYPVAVAFTADKDNSTAFLEWLKIIAGQGVTILLSFAFFRMFEAEIAFMIQDSSETSGYSKTLIYVVMIVLLSLIKNSEKILRTFNINTFPSGDTARMIGGGIGRTMALAYGATQVLSAGLGGRQGISQAGRLDANGGLTHGMRLSSTAGGASKVGTTSSTAGPGVGHLTNRDIGRNLGREAFNKQSLAKATHDGDPLGGIGDRYSARKEAGIKSNWDALKQGGIVGAIRNHQARVGFAEGYNEARQATAASGQAAYAAMFSDGKGFDTGTSISGMSPSNTISDEDARNAFKLYERGGGAMDITTGTNAVAGGFHSGTDSDIGYINIADKSVPSDATMQASGYFVSADIERANGVVSQQTLFLSSESYKAGDIIDGGIVDKQKYDLGDGLWGYIMKSPEELNSDWKQVQEAIHNPVEEQTGGE